MKKLNPLHIIDVSNIIFVGDTHGKFRELGFLIHKKHKITNSVFFALGDNGLGFEKDEFYNYELNRLSGIFGKGNNHLFFIRGNHDNPAYYTEIKHYGDNITILPDYSVVNVENKNILVIGGAISIDRMKRISGRSYWYDEKVKFDEKKLQTFKDINIIATHTSPDFCFPFSKANIQNWLLMDGSLNQELNEERETMSKIFNILNDNKNNIITHWIYGHFHNSNRDFINNVEFLALNELEFFSL